MAAAPVPVFHNGKGEVRATGLGFARSLAWVALILVLTLSTGLSVYIGSQAKKTLMRKQQEFAALLAENLNHQIYRRFTLPTLIGFGRIALRQSVQYERLDQVVQSTIHGLDVKRLRIFGHDHTVTYSTDRDEAGREDLSTPMVDEAAKADDPIFQEETQMPYWKAFFLFDLPDETFRLRTTFPLRIENRLSSSEPEGPVMGVLEFTQDTTPDIKRSIRFQQVIFVATLFSSCLFLALLLFLIRRAERAVAARMAEEQRLTRELHQSEKLAGMGRVVAGIAHEIRNPLGIIRSSSELLLKRDAGQDALTGRILQAINDEACRLSRTVGDFLDYARPLNIRREPVDLSAVLTEVLAFFSQNLHERDINVLCSGLTHEPLMVAGDKDMLYRAFFNIVGNATQAVGRSGTIAVDLQRKAGRVTAVVHDSGPGIPADMLDKILDPFVTTKDDGTGLGLPIVANIITGHGGSLSLDNAEEGGARARVELPAA